MPAGSEKVPQLLKMTLPQASEFELGLLVLNYLEDNGWTRAVTAFKK